MFVARRENRRASHASGTANSMGSTNGSTAGHGTTAKQTNSASTMDETAHPSQARAGVGVGSANPSRSPNIIGPNVTMVSTDASSHNPTSPAASGMPAACALVAAPKQRARQPPANSATIQSGDITSSKRSCRR